LRLSRIASVSSCAVPTKRISGMPRGPHSQAGQITPVSSDFIEPGGTFMSRRRMSPFVTASRCWQIASSAQPHFSSAAGSSTCQARWAKWRGSAGTARARRLAGQRRSAASFAFMISASAAVDRPATSRVATSTGSGRRRRRSAAAAARTCAASCAGPARRARGSAAWPCGSNRLGLAVVGDVDDLIDHDRPRARPLQFRTSSAKSIVLASQRNTVALLGMPAFLQTERSVPPSAIAAQNLAAISGV
jgi:hypothetical protein